MEYIMADIAKIAEDLSNLTVLEAAELATMLEEKWGVSAAAAPMQLQCLPVVTPVAQQKKRLNLM
jgi:large subunit ribosomal protein L7/L12